MKLWWAPLLLLAPAATGAILLREDATLNLASQTAPAQFTSGDIGTATIGASKTSATVVLGSLPLLTANDILRLDSSNAAWNAHIELVSHSGWGASESITVSLADGLLVENQVVITLGSLVQITGDVVDLPVGATDTEIRVIGTGTGTLTFDVVLRPDGQTGPTLYYRVVLTVG